MSMAAGTCSPWPSARDRLRGRSAAAGGHRRRPMQAQRVARMSDSDPPPGSCWSSRPAASAGPPRAGLVPPVHRRTAGQPRVQGSDRLHRHPAAARAPPIRQERPSGTATRCSNRERDAAIAIAERFDFLKFDPDKITAVRLGLVEGRLYRIELAYQHKKKQRLLGNIASPALDPERDESILTDLTRHFGARPSASILGSGSVIPMAEGSFEAPDSPTTHWTIRDSVRLVPGYPHGEVALDDTVALDGLQSLRFHNTEATRQFSSVGQAIAIKRAPGSGCSASSGPTTCAPSTQREDLVGLSLTWSTLPAWPSAAPSGRRGGCSPTPGSPWRWRRPRARRERPHRAVFIGLWDRLVDGSIERR